jgi:hypothetical protein
MGIQKKHPANPAIASTTITITRDGMIFSSETPVISDRFLGQDPSE